MSSEAGSVRTRYIIPGIVGCALFMQMLDSTVVTTALPAMARSFDVAPVRMNVAITSYLMSVAVFVPLSGWAADRFGARRVFIAAIALFTLTSLACALSQSITHLVIGRIVQGLAGAMMVPVGRVILLRTVPKSELMQAMSFLSIPALIGPVVGPPLGGLLVTYASWHWIFLINLPIGILGIGLVLKYVNKVDDEIDPAPLDWMGFMLTGIALAALVFSFEAVGHNLLPLPWLAALLAVGVASALLYRWHHGRAAKPIVDLRLLRIPTFSIASLGGNLCRFSIGAMPFLLVMQLQVGFGLSPLAAGMITFASAAGALLMKTVAVPIIRALGFRNTLIYNAVITGLFVALCATFTPMTPYWLLVTLLLVGGFFRSLQLTAVNSLTYADIGPEQMSRASSLAAMAQQLGVSLGVGVAAVTLNLSMMARNETQLSATDVNTGFIVVGILISLSLFSFKRLSPSAGDEVSGSRARRQARKPE